VKKLIALLIAMCLLSIAGCAIIPAPFGVNVNTDGEIAGDPYEGPGSPWVYQGTQWYFNGLPYYYYGSYGWGPWGLYPSSYVVNRTVVVTPGTTYHATVPVHGVSRSVYGGQAYRNSHYVDPRSHPGQMNRPPQNRPSGPVIRRTAPSRPVKSSSSSGRKK
jgi:hypothetical protein